jgi:hypothetical protein
LLAVLSGYVAFSSRVETEWKPGASVPEARQ